MMFDIRCKHPAHRIYQDYVEPVQYYDGFSGEICERGGEFIYYCLDCGAEIDKAELPQAYWDSLKQIASLDAQDLPI